jgi:hypothetical protein
MTYSNDPNDPMRAVSEQQERAAALEAIINNAPDSGIDEALETFGPLLTDTEKELLRTLTPEELTALKSILSKLGNQIFRSPIIIFPVL